MKRVFLLAICIGALFIVPIAAIADQTVTVTATSADISEDLDLKTVATLFGQAKDLEQFEQMLNNPDSAFSNLDLNGDGDVDYLRVVETADQNRHLVVIQAVLAKDIYQDVASIFVEKDPESESVTVQVIGDEYIYGANYIIEPIYICRPMIYDWFWGPSWVAWHSPFYWDYWPIWWHPYHSIAHHLYWEHCYWHHHYYPICSYRTGHHHHPHYAPMHDRVSRSDYAMRNPERSFASRNVSTRYTNARDIDRNRQTTIRSAAGNRSSAVGTPAATRVSNRSMAETSRTFGSSNVRAAASRSDVTAPTTSHSRVASTSTTPSRNASISSTTRSSNKEATPVRSTSTVNRTSSVSTATRSTTPSVNRTSNSSSSTMRSSSSNTSTRSSSTSVRSSSGSSTMRSSTGGTMRTSGGSGGSSSSSRGGGGTTRR